MLIEMLLGPVHCGYKYVVVMVTKMPWYFFNIWNSDIQNICYRKYNSDYIILVLKMEMI